MHGEGSKAPVSENVARPAVASCRRVVIKVGTRVLTRADGRLALPRLYQVVELVVDLWKAGKQVLLVSSGAVGVGRDALKLEEIPSENAARQACAAVGQARLMSLYQNGFDPQGLSTAQVLLTEADFADRGRYLNLRATLATLLRHRVVPIINENDVVSTAEIAVTKSDAQQVFGDNDRLSALVASKLGADLLLLLTDVRGVYDADPSLHPEAQIISCVDSLDAFRADTSGPSSKVGRGGMRSKVEAACVACRSGCHVVIAAGTDPAGGRRAAYGEDEGTWFPAHGRLSARRRWIAFATQAHGTLHVDAGAATALLTKGASLLPAGVTQIEGRFQKGDVVEVRDCEGGLLGRGMIQVDSDQARSWVAGKRPAGARTLMRHEDLVLRDAFE